MVRQTTTAATTPLQLVYDWYATPNRMHTAGVGGEGCGRTGGTLTYRTTIVTTGGGMLLATKEAPILCATTTELLSAARQPLIFEAVI